MRKMAVAGNCIQRVPGIQRTRMRNFTNPFKERNKGARNADWQTELFPSAYASADTFQQFAHREITVGKNVAIIGGGLTGCEIAYDLYLKGHNPIIIEAKNDLIAAKGVCLANSSYLRDFFTLHNVEVHLESGVTEIKKDSIVIKEKSGEIKEVKVDNIITSIGYNEDPKFPSSRHVHIVGDAYQVGNLRTVIWRAWKVAMKI